MEVEQPTERLASAIQAISVNVNVNQAQNGSPPADTIRVAAQSLYDSLPLPADKIGIRVLDIRLDEDGSLRADMSVIDFATSPHFTALSYV
jgi:hypothetical protein